MSLAKKIKFTLLTSAVMLSSKGVYAMHSDNDSTTTPGRVASFSSLMPAFLLSNPFPRPSEETPLVPQVKAMIVRATGIDSTIEIDDQNKKKLQTAIDQIPYPDFLNRLDPIETNLLKKFAPLYPSYCGKWELSALMQGYSNIVTTALLLPIEEIVARGDALHNMTEDLFTSSLSFISIARHHPLSEPSTKYAGKTNYFTPIRSDKLDLIRDTLTLHHHQIDNRTKALRENDEHLLPQESHHRLVAVQSLLKLEAAEIMDRGEAMKKFQVAQYIHDQDIPAYLCNATPLYHDGTLVAASYLTNVDLTLRLEQLDSLVGDQKYALKAPKTEVQKSAFALSSNDFASRLSSIQPYKSLLEDLNGHYLRTIAMAFALPADQINARLSAIKQYKELLKETSMNNIMIQFTVEMIYTLAQQQHYKNYFTKKFLPRMGAKFREVNRSTVSDQNLFEMMKLPSDNDFTHQKITSALSRFDEIYREMFELPPLERPYGILTSSSTQSSGPSSSSSSVAGSSTSYQHDIPASRLDCICPFETSLKNKCG